jgi:hypothetical protein
VSHPRHTFLDVYLTLRCRQLGKEGSGSPHHRHWPCLYVPSFFPFGLHRLFRTIFIVSICVGVFMCCAYQGFGIDVSLSIAPLCYLNRFCCTQLQFQSIHSIVPSRFVTFSNLQVVVHDFHSVAFKFSVSLYLFRSMHTLLNIQCCVLFISYLCSMRRTRLLCCYFVMSNFLMSIFQAQAPI